MKSKPNAKKTGAPKGKKKSTERAATSAKKTATKPVLAFGEVVAVKQVDEKSLRVVGCLGSGSGLGSY